jgi:acetoin utilization protein AcuB
MKHDQIDPGQDVTSWRESPIRVMDRMTHPVITVAPDAPVETAWNLMKSHKIRHLPVVDHDLRPVGIITGRDLQQVVFDLATVGPAAANSPPSAGIAVERLMTRDVITVRPELEIQEAARLMHERKIGALPVVKDDRVVGIITVTDALRVIADRRAEPGMP